MFARLLAVIAFALMLGAGAASAGCGHHNQFCSTAAHTCAKGCSSHGHLHGSACHAGQHTHWCKKCCKRAQEWTNHGCGSCKSGCSGHKSRCSGHKHHCGHAATTSCDKCATKAACASCGKAGCTSCPAKAAVCGTCGKEGCTSCPPKHGCGHRHATHCGQGTWCSASHSCGSANWCKHASCTHLCANHCAGHSVLPGHRPCTADGLRPELRQKVEELRRIHSTGA